MKTFLLMFLMLFMVGCTNEVRLHGQFELVGKYAVDDLSKRTNSRNYNAKDYVLIFKQVDQPSDNPYHGMVYVTSDVWENSKVGEAYVPPAREQISLFGTFFFMFILLMGLGIFFSHPY